MRIVKTRTTFGNLTASLELPPEKPNLNHTTLFRFSQIPESQSPIKECKNYLDTFKEPLQQKFFFPRQPLASKSVELQRASSENQRRYQNYQRLTNYSIKKYNTQAVERKMLRGSAQNKKSLNKDKLKRFISEKMTDELASQIRLQNNDQKVQSQLKDYHQRQKLFEQSILVDRFLSMKRQIRVTKDTKKIFQTQKNPKHFHLNEVHRDFNTFYRRKFTRQCITFNYESKIAEFQITKFRKRYQDNRILMNNLMSNYSKQVNIGQQEQNNKIIKVIRRLFLNYSSIKNSIEQSFKVIQKPRLHQFFKDFQFDQPIQILNEKICQVDFFTFSELIFKLSSKYTNSDENIVAQFLKRYIVVKEHIYIPKECLQFAKKQEIIQNYFKINKIQKRLQGVCQRLSRVGSEDSYGQKWLNFDSFHQLMLTLKIYPSFISKIKLKFYYLFCESINQVINIKQILQIIAYVSLVSEEKFQRTFFQLIDQIKKCNL